MRLLSLLFLFLFMTMPSFAADDEDTLNAKVIEDKNLQKPAEPYLTEPESYKDNRYKARKYIRRDKRYIKTDDGEYELENQKEQRFIRTEDGKFKEIENKYDSSEEAQIVIASNRCAFVVLQTITSEFILANKFLCTSLKKGEVLVGNFNSNGYTDVLQGKFRCNILIEETEIETKEEAKKRLQNYCQ